MKWSANLWCVIGLLLSLVPVFFSWAEVGANGTCILHRNHGIINVLFVDHVLFANLGEPITWRPVYVSGAVFLAATIIAVVTPLGSIGQGIGVALLALFGSGEYVPQYSLCAHPVKVVVGATFGTLAVAFQTWGMIRPVGIDFRFKRIGGHPRFWTFSRKRHD